ncbi:DUF6445 family protein [Colwellia sp. MEBiC06753]
MLEVNQQFTPMVKTIGHEQPPIIVIDDFVLNLDAAQQLAESASFNQDPNSYYPAVRSQLPNQYIIDSLRAVYQGIYKIYQIPRTFKLQPQLAYFSLINQPANTLSFLQRFPHFDTPRPFYFAVLHYVNDQPHGGTGFFRHRSTQFERINEQRVDGYMEKCNQEIAELGEPAPAYHIDNSEMYELYEVVDYKPNRLVIYPGNLLHSTIVNEATDIDDNPKTGRVTANMFVEFVC